MKFGLIYELEVDKTRYTELDLHKAVVEQVVRAEELGFEYIWLPEHHFNTEYSHISAPEVILSFLAAKTSTIKLGPAVVILPIHNPVLVAERYATLDVLSDGRLEMGVGRGLHSLWFQTFAPDRYRDVKTLTTETRGIFLEGIEVLKKAWSDAALVHEGPDYSFPTPLDVIPKPIQRPHPRLWAPCVGEDSLKTYPPLGLNAFTQTKMRPVAKIEAEISCFRENWATALNEEERAIAGPGEMAVQTVTYCAPTRKQALDELRPYWEWYITKLIDFYLADKVKQAEGKPLPEYMRPWPSYPEPKFEEFVELGMICVGSPDDCYEYLAQLDGWGMDTILNEFQVGGMPFDMVLRSLELFGTEVIPRLQSDASARTATAVR